MTSIADLIQPGEKVEWAGGPSFLIYIPAYVICLFLFIFLIGIPLLIYCELNRRGHKFIVTNKRVMHHYSLISRSTSSARYDNIQDIHMKQGIIGRIFGISTLLVNTAGSSVIEISFFGLNDATTVKKAIEKHLLKGKRR